MLLSFKLNLTVDRVISKKCLGNISCCDKVKHDILRQLVRSAF